MNIIITGASSGIGKTVAGYLTDKGHQVIGTSRHPSQSDDKFEILKLDVTDEASVANFTKNVLQKFTKIDVLINNAGFVISGPSESTTMDECKSQFETNYFGVVRMTNQFLPLFRKQRDGLIINISSLGGLISMPFQAHYSASKFALEGYTEALRMELAPYHVRVCNINPGDLNTSFTNNRHIIHHVERDYKSKFTELLNRYEKEERRGSDPLLVAKLIYSLIGKKKVRMRYLVGKRSQTIGYTMKRLFGSTIFEKVMMSMWKVNK